MTYPHSRIVSNLRFKQKTKTMKNSSCSLQEAYVRSKFMRFIFIIHWWYPPKHLPKTHKLNYNRSSGQSKLCSCGQAYLPNTKCVCWLQEPCIYAISCKIPFVGSQPRTTPKTAAGLPALTRTGPDVEQQSAWVGCFNTMQEHWSLTLSCTPEPRFLLTHILGDSSTLVLLPYGEYSGWVLGS